MGKSANVIYKSPSHLTFSILQLQPVCICSRSIKNGQLGSGIVPMIVATVASPSSVHVLPLVRSLRSLTEDPPVSNVKLVFFLLMIMMMIDDGCVRVCYAACGLSGLMYGLIMSVTGLSCLYSCFYRTKLRNQYGLVDSPCSDSGVHFFCELCALCQEYRELNNRGFDMGIGDYFTLLITD